MKLKEIQWNSWSSLYVSANYKMFKSELFIPQLLVKYILINSQLKKSDLKTFSYKLRILTKTDEYPLKSGSIKK